MKSGALSKVRKMCSFLKKLLFGESLKLKQKSSAKETISYIEREDICFQRSNFYGANFYWWAADSTGAIGQFTAGYGGIPKTVFTNKLGWCLKFYAELKEEVPTAI